MGSCQSVPPQAHNNTHKLDKTSHTEGIHISEEFRSTNSQDKGGGGKDEPTTHPILREIEQSQESSGKPFGRILDAGTGFSSLDWIRHLVANGETFGVTDWTAVTASETMANQLKDFAKQHGMKHQGGENKDDESEGTSGVLFGNWFDNTGGSSRLLEGELYDTILVDYFIGAVDGYTPYLQDCIFERLRQHLKPGGRMYLVGLEPIPESEKGPGDIICQTKRLRDTCIVLGGERCYREYPLHWVLRNMKRASLEVLEHKKYPLRHSMADIGSQLQVARQKLPRITNKCGHEGLACMMGESIALLERRAKTVTRNLPGNCIAQGFDYLVIARKPEE